MSDTELNEKIAGMRGWFLDSRDGPLIWRSDKGSGWPGCLPDFLAPERLPELMDLADEVLGSWQLTSHCAAFASDSENKPLRAYNARVLLPSGMVAPRASGGITRSHALAHAIVAYKENPAFDSPTPPDFRPDANPVPDSPLDGHDCEHGAMPVDVFLNEKGHQECHRCGLRAYIATASKEPTR